ncbi:hypothetical protein GBA52_010294 [Prunus armeniaca]|nr:hypothetical protein GBA52_010294 [Prunus armeniaca]
MDTMVNIHLDMGTRWNATYKLLDDTFKYKNVFTRMVEENAQFIAYFKELEKDAKRNPVKRVGPPTESDSENAQVFVHFLKKIYETTLKLSVTKTCTSNIMFTELVGWKLAMLKISFHNLGAEPSKVEAIGDEVESSLLTLYNEYRGVFKDIFAFRSSMVASENVFSLDKRIVDPFRSSLTPKMVEVLVCTHDWLRVDEFNLYEAPTDEEIPFYKELEEIQANHQTSPIATCGIINSRRTDSELVNNGLNFGLPTTLSRSSVVAHRFGYRTNSTPTHLNYKK